MRLLLFVLLLVGCKEDPLAVAAQAEGQQDYVLAAEMYTKAAVEAACPDRGTLLLRRAIVQELDGRGSAALGSIDKAVEHCPDLAEARWARAERRIEAGDRDAALDDARAAAASIADARFLVRKLSMELDAEQAVRARASSLVRILSSGLQPDAEDVPSELTEAPSLARQVPLPITTRYAVRQTMTSPVSFTVDWEETWSYRGDAAEGHYLLVRSLDVPPMDRGLPLYYRLAMSNLRLPMRFKVNTKGEVLDSGWLRDGPNRGMRPEMLGPQIEGLLKRRRLFDPGREGRRAPGDTWRGEDVRVVDGRPIPVSFTSTARDWVKTLGIDCLRVESTLTGEGYAAEEAVWIHPETAVPIRWSRAARYRIRADRGVDEWREKTEAALIEVAGAE